LRDQDTPFKGSSAGNDFLRSLNGFGGGGGGLRPPGAPRPAAPPHAARLGGLTVAGGGFTSTAGKTFARLGAAPAGPGGGGGVRQAAITDYLGAGGGGGGAAPALQVRLPAGMVNHGNTCYLNAVLQALLSVPAFVSGLRGARLEGLRLPGDGVVAALRGCLEEQRGAAAAGEG
jgi:hypothetical protein